MSDLISRQQAIDAIKTWGLIDGLSEGQAIEILADKEKLPPAQPEHRDALEKAVAVEAISDELMSRFDISVTYAYEVAEAAVNRIEVMAKELEGGEQDG